MRRVLLVAATACAFAASPQFDLRDTVGTHHTSQEWRNQKAVVVFFTMTDCPLSNGYVPEMNRIAAEYKSKGVAVYAAHSDPFVGDAAVRKHAEEFGFTFPVLLDSKLILARAAGATTVPEVAVFSSSGELRYLGRIDNRMEDITRRRNVATEFELRAVLDAVVAGRPPPSPEPEPSGVPSTFKESNETDRLRTNCGHTNCCPNLQQGRRADPV